MLFLNAKITLNIWTKLNYRETIIYDLFGNLWLFKDEEELEILLMGFIGLYKLPQEDFPDIIPFSSVVRETYNIILKL